MSSTSPDRTRYASGAIAIHWIVAVLIATNFALVWSAEDAPKEDAMANHKAIGISILLLTVLRIVWRLTHRAPPLSETLKAWEAALARVVHALFYFLMVAIPFSGWAMSSAASGKPVGMFGVIDMPPLPFPQDRAIAGVFADTHETLATLMLALFALHAAGALKHQFLDKDGTLARMLPFLRAG